MALAVSEFLNRRRPAVKANLSEADARTLRVLEDKAASVSRDVERILSDINRYLGQVEVREAGDIQQICRYIEGEARGLEQKQSEMYALYDEIDRLGSSY